MQGGLSRGNVGAIAQLMLSAGARDPAQIAALADASRQLGDLGTTKRLLGSVILPDGDAFSAMRALAGVLDETACVAQHGETPVPTPFIRRHGFLAPDTLAAVKNLTHAHLEKFVSSEVHNGDYVGVSMATRRSVVLPDPHEFRALLLPSLLELVAGLDLKEILEVGELDLDRIELQVTAHGDGAYFRPHTDASLAANARRELSFVLYFRLRADGFSGGDLKLFDASEAQKRYTSESFTCIEPDDNSLILFPSRCVHEVSPVHMAAQPLSAGRFSLNGWIHQRHQF